jgi:hypothetical protein
MSYIAYELLNLYCTASRYGERLDDWGSNPEGARDFHFSTVPRLAKGSTRSALQLVPRAFPAR